MGDERSIAGCVRPSKSPERRYNGPGRPFRLGVASGSCARRSGRWGSAYDERMTYRLAVVGLLVAVLVVGLLTLSAAQRAEQAAACAAERAQRAETIPTLWNPPGLQFSAPPGVPLWSPRPTPRPTPRPMGLRPLGPRPLPADPCAP